jgi:hypothetical protein
LIVRALAVLLAACAVLGAAACSSTGEAPKVYRRGDSGPNRFPEAGPWRESEVSPPPYPRDQDLIEFEPTGQTTYRFYVDGSSLTVGPDRVIRFSLVIRSAEGARTVRYSGVRCESGEWKDYAYGREGGRWERDPDPRWRKITEQRINNYQRTLASEFFCFGGVFSGGPVGDAESILQTLKYPGRPDPRVPGRKY